MPDFVRYPVRDRASWEFYKERMAYRTFLSREELEARCRALDCRDRPLVIPVGGTYSMIRGLMGTEAASLAFYDDPEMVHEMIAWRLARVREYVFPLIERLKPEAVQFGEDLCYNHGMLLSPAHFEEFCAGYYREVCGCAMANGVPARAIDTDGNAMEFTGLAEACGANAIFPYEVKAGNDLLALRERHPDFIFLGWLEKECVNEGNQGLIEREIRSKVPPLLAKGRYFPNGDHGLQPMVTFPNLCRFMTLLHEVTGNPEGEFPRMPAGRAAARV
jgi:uroporphyrinogen decarboxylase